MRNYLKASSTVVTIAIGLAAILPQRATAWTIVENGAPRATIVIAKSAVTPAADDAVAAKVSVAARDLQEYIRKMSGAVLPVVGDDQNPQGALILVGKSGLTAARKLAIPDGLTTARKEEGFIIASQGNWLALAGDDLGPYHGTEYAVYDFLERLGVRWFMPGEFGEVVPTQTTVKFADDLNVAQKPDFIQRNWWLHTTPEMAEQERRWKIRNKMNPDNMWAIPGDSSVRGFVADAELAKTKPELFAKNFDGSVNTALPNLTNPEAVKIAADKMKEYFRKNPNEISIGIAPDDGLPRDFSPETVKRNQGFVDLLGREGVQTEVSTSEEWFEFINAVTREVKKEFPDRIITTNGYSLRNLPPQGVTLDPNLSVMFAAIWSDTMHAHDNPRSWQMLRQGQLLKRWAEMNERVWIYGYRYTMIVTALTPVPITRKLARDFPLMKKWGVAGFIDETRNVYMESGITTKYINARLEWDADADVNALLSDFFTKWYGAAARPSQAFWDALEETIETTPLLGHEDRFLPYVYSPQLIARLETNVKEAERLADSERAKVHVRVDRLILEHLKNYMAMSNAEFAGNFAEAARQAGAMMELRKQLAAISTFFTTATERHPGSSEGYESGIWYWGVLDRKVYYQKLADMTSGKTGDLVALLPETAQFRIDPLDEGRFDDWYMPDVKAAGWRDILSTKPFYAQGYLAPDGQPYVGAVWYRFKVNVPKLDKGKRVMLYAPTVETEAWAWVNGKYIGHRPYHEAYERPLQMEVDVTDALKPGMNDIALRVSTGLNRAQAAGGLLSRVFLYSPKPGVEAAAKP